MTTWWQQPVAAIHQDILDRAWDRQNQLTKPAGSLGQLEQISTAFAGWQGKLIPELDRVSICVFAADHGVAAEGVSAFPQAVTAEMIRNFSQGGAAIAVIARQQQADFSVVNLGTVSELETLPGVISHSLGPGTNNFVKQAAMSDEQLQKAMMAGAEQVLDHCQLFIGGEMGIGNTTAAAALASALLELPISETVGKGTGVSEEGLSHKRNIVGQALQFHRSYLDSPLAILRRLGGFEIAALSGAFIAAAQRGIPVLVDGYITSVAALAACLLNPEVRTWMMFAHRSAEPGHRHVLESLAAKPLLDLGMRLGEGSGAGIALPIIQAALKLYREMATFNEAEVGGQKTEDRDRKME